MENTFSIYTLPGWKGSVFKFDENKTKTKENNLSEKHGRIKCDKCCNHLLNRLIFSFNLWKRRKKKQIEI